MNDKKLMKAKNLKIIDHLGTYYATFDGSKMWKVEKWIYRLLMMCDGKRNFDQLAEEISRISEFPIEEIKIGLKPILNELENEGLVTAV